MRVEARFTLLAVLVASAFGAMGCGSSTGRLVDRLPPGVLSNFGQPRSMFVSDHLVTKGSTSVGPAYSYSDLKVSAGRVVGYDMYFGAANGVNEATAQVIAGSEFPSDSRRIWNSSAPLCQKSIFGSKTLQKVVGVGQVRVTFRSDPLTSRPLNRSHIRRAIFAPAARGAWSC